MTETNKLRTLAPFFIQNVSIRFISDQLIELHRGQGMEIWFRDTYTCPTQDQYVELVNKSECWC